MTKKQRCIYLAIINTLLGIIIIIYRPLLPIISDTEVKLYEYSVIIKRVFFNIDTDKLKKDEVVFIDTSNDIKIYETPQIDDPNTEGINIYDDVSTPKRITGVNRKKLGQCLAKLLPYKDQIKFIVCDITLEFKTSEDDSLIPYIKAFDKKIIFAKNNSAQLYSSVPTGYTNVYEINEQLINYPLSINNEATLPLKMYQKLHRTNDIDLHPFGTASIPIIKIGNSLFHNNPIIEPRIRVFNFNQPDSSTSYDMVFRLSRYTESIGQMNTQNKIIIFADLNIEGSDKHSSILGDTLGCLVVLNAYMSILYNDNEISLIWLTYIFIAFFLFFYEAQIHKIPYFYELKRRSMGHSSKRWLLKKKFMNSKISAFLSNPLRLSNKQLISLKKYIKIDFWGYITLLLFLSIIAFFSYILFQFHIEFIAIWFIIIIEKYIFTLFKIFQIVFVKSIN